MNALDTPNKSLFLSYSRKQTLWCDELYSAIDTYTQFYRWRDNKIAESSDWWDSICLNIEGCFAFVALLSPDYLNSVYCMGELEYALKLNKPVIALVLEESDYPEELGAKRLQFARVKGLAMPNVTNRVLNATNQILQDYMQGKYSTDIHPRPHLRSLVPVPPKDLPVPEEDIVLKKQVDEISIHGQIPTREMIRRFNEESDRNLRLARDLLVKIEKREDIPSFFDVAEEESELQIREREWEEAERQRQRLKQAREEYEELEHYLETTKSHVSRAKAFGRFVQSYANFGDPKDLWRMTQPTLEQALATARGFTGKRNTDWQPIVMKLGEIDPTTPVPDMAMCLVPVGKFMMGNDKEAFDYNKKREWVQGVRSGGEQRIEKPYWIARYPVTNAQWKLGVQAGVVKEPSGNGLTWYNDSAMADCPVVKINWFESLKFSEWVKCTLPTEPLWEYGSRGVENWVYPWGNELDGSRLVHNGTPTYGNNRPAPVTEFASWSSWVGAMHLSGNVREWQLSAYADYPYVASDGREGDLSSTDVLRVLRGGSFFNTTNFLRSADRYGNSPTNVDDNTGFRCVRT